jgi:2-phosphosulfolactate phosphatase
MCFDQGRYDVRCEWALPGLHALRDVSDVIVIVDVLSFSTAVDVALSRGATVFPFRWRDESARAFAADNNALMAVNRADMGAYSLSPASLCSIPTGSRLVLPSPNGSTLCLSAGRGSTFAACLRNATAVAQIASATGRSIGVIPAGERWEDGSLRPCLEDLVGAGAVVARLPGRLSPEAETARTVFFHFQNRLYETISSCGSGRELIESGFAEDVRLASEHDVSSIAPILVDGRFVDHRSKSDEQTGNVTRRL